jgi:hypothetical protein
MEVPVASPVSFDSTQLQYNIDIDQSRDTLYVRKSGVYLIVYQLWPVEPCQFTILVNGTAISEGCVGISTGANEYFNRVLLRLKDNDAISLRNVVSAIGTVHFPTLIGGSAQSINASVTIVKVATMNDTDDSWWCRRKNYCHHNEHKFEELKEKMLCDPCLMARGCDAYGFFNSNVDQSVALEAPIIFNGAIEKHCMDIKPLPSGEIQIRKDGIYNMVLLAATELAAQFAVFVNGADVPATHTGLNTGAGQIIFHCLLHLKEKDIVSVRNHTSLVGTVVLKMNAGGSLVGNSVDLILQRIAPDWYRHAKSNSDWGDRHDCLEKIDDEFYDDFLTYLFEKRCVRIQGAESFFSLSSSDVADVALEKPITFEYTKLIRDACHKQGEPCVHIKEGGLYFITFDAECDLPSQFTIFVNDTPVPVTTTGSDSGSCQTSIRTMLSLCRGDVVKVVNHTSFMGTIPFTISPGGTDVGINCQMIGLNIAPRPPCKKDDDCCPCPQKKC